MSTIEKQGLVARRYEDASELDNSPALKQCFVEEAELQVGKPIADARTTLQEQHEQTEKILDRLKTSVGKLKLTDVELEKLLQGPEQLDELDSILSPLKGFQKALPTKLSEAQAVAENLATEVVALQEQLTAERNKVLILESKVLSQEEQLQQERKEHAQSVAALAKSLSTIQQPQATSPSSSSASISQEKEALTETLRLVGSVLAKNTTDQSIDLFD